MRYDEIGAAQIAELGRKASDPETINITTDSLMPGVPPSIPILWDRDRQALISVKDEISKYRRFPERRTGTAKAQTIDSFIDLTARHMTPESAIFADLDWRKPSLTAVIDYHPRRNLNENDVRVGVEPTKDADWSSHRIRYDFPFSEEWKQWAGGDGVSMEQGDFAFMIEDRIPHLVSPDEGDRRIAEEYLQTAMANPAEILMLSRGLQIRVAAEVKGVVTLNSGEGEMTFVEQHQDAAGGKIKVPGAFVIAIPVFLGGQDVRIPVRLRYRVRGGKVVWSYNIYRPDVIVGDRVRDDAREASGHTGLPLYEGEPEGSA